ncbi:MAG: polyamine aminopropyltransferase [Candidatus Sericytochromatia bacterium]|nr:polyamine aminopropyltransferase [Candidatus Sericytochromatia bacterium]
MAAVPEQGPSPAAPQPGKGLERPGVLYASVAIIATCGIVYELIIGASSSYLLGDSIWQFSITIGLFLSAMGLGSWLSQWVRSGLFLTFILTELAIAVVGGFSALGLFTGYAASPELYPPLQYGLTLAIGTMVGLEIPLLLRMLEHREELRYNAAYVLSLDYVGGLLGSVAFPLLMLPQLGLIKAALLTGLLNAGVVVLGLVAYAPRFARSRKPVAVGATLTLAGLAWAFSQAPALEEALEQGLYRDRIVHTEQTLYQRLTVTHEDNDLRLFINGNLQYSSLDEHRYHEALIHVPIARMGVVPRDVLVLGGGDGLAARELLKYDGVRRIDLVDLDPAMTRLHRTHPALTALNGHSLTNPRLHPHHLDALVHLRRDRARYDMLVIDLPDPNAEALVKLYTREFYALAARHLRPHGALVVQASSPYFAREAYWCIARTVAAAGLTTQHYHLDVPTFGDWGFVIGSPGPLPNPPWRFPVATRYLTPELAPGLFHFGRDEDDAVASGLAINTAFSPVLLRYYQRGWGAER